MPLAFTLALFAALLSFILNISPIISTIPALLLEAIIFSVANVNIDLLRIIYTINKAPINRRTEQIRSAYTKKFSSDKYSNGIYATTSTKNGL
jgi:hypothetical protein